jgi:hypothetical protein
VDGRETPSPRQLTTIRAVGKLATTERFSRLNLKKRKKARNQLSSVIDFLQRQDHTAGSRRRHFLLLRESGFSDDRLAGSASET